ncbi:unnamed protein product [Nesidiocoris tenuis]|uniref:Uncharacterized protein n=1 Tax=Nesidiocoris tenuis TaxID=355587 RepID=A0A6H5G031_9HEMI|nr:unnamed protein product [Nesidiocoris tenuis]
MAFTSSMTISTVGSCAKRTGRQKLYEAREAEVCNHSHHETKPLRWAGRRYFALWRCICGLGHPIARGTILSDLMGSPLRPEWSRASGIAALPFTLMYIAEGRGSLKGWRATGARTRKERPPVPPPPGRQSHDQRPLQLCIERSRPSRLEG